MVIICVFGILDPLRLKVFFGVIDYCLAHGAMECLPCLPWCDSPVGCSTTDKPGLGQGIMVKNI